MTTFVRKIDDDKFQIYDTRLDWSGTTPDLEWEETRKKLGLFARGSLFPAVKGEIREKEVILFEGSMEECEEWKSNMEGRPVKLLYEQKMCRDLTKEGYEYYRKDHWYFRYKDTIGQRILPALDPVWREYNTIGGAMNRLS